MDYVIKSKLSSQVHILDCGCKLYVDKCKDFLFDYEYVVTCSACEEREKSIDKMVARINAMQSEQ